ncbi:MAG: GNAT family N-acetyltransferase [Bdellovibrionales bacterium]|nr:GNAT family N-acetyltransferase [Bdellovibrionales bacterium]
MEILFPFNESTNRMAFRAKNYFSFEVGKYRVFTADSRFEVYQALQLRGQVFLKEQNQLDMDDFDVIADHILIEDTSKNRIIGTYRLVSNIFSDSFYSQTEFNMESFLKLPGVKVELGRACIHPDFRNGRSIDLLWRGISTYLRLLNGKYLFGCSSVFLEQDNAEAIVQNLVKNHTNNSFEISAKIPFATKENILDFKEPKTPGLLQSYLNAGAQLCGEPYWDKKWNCVDFLTVLDIDCISEKYKKHYFSKSLSYVENF